MSRYRITEAIERFEKMYGFKPRKKELSQLVKGKSLDSRYITFSRLVNGHAKLPYFDLVVGLCEKLECDPNFLFGWDKNKNEQV